MALLYRLGLAGRGGLDPSLRWWKSEVPGQSIGGFGRVEIWRVQWKWGTYTTSKAELVAGG